MLVAAYLRKYSSIEVTPVRVTDGTAHGDYILNVCLDEEGFQAIPHITAYKDQQIKGSSRRKQATLLVL